MQPVTKQITESTLLTTLPIFNLDRDKVEHYMSQHFWEIGHGPSEPSLEYSIRADHSAVWLNIPYPPLDSPLYTTCPDYSNPGAWLAEQVAVAIYRTLQELCQS